MLFPINTLPGLFQSLLAENEQGDNTFYSRRVFELFPQIASANSGWNTHTAEGSQVFGSVVLSSSLNNSDYIEWTVYVPAGTYLINVLYQKHTNRGIFSISVNGGALFDSCDQYDGTGVKNQIFTSLTFTLTEGANTIRLQKNGKNASSSSYLLAVTHAQLVKQNAGSALASVANVPHIINIPVVFADSHTNWNTLSINSNNVFGTRLVSSGAQNDTITFSFWAPAGNFTLELLYGKSNDHGILGVSVDGNAIGTIDGYNSIFTRNNLDTSLTGTLATTGMHTLVFTMATKNAISTNYVGDLHHALIRMTSITATLTADTAPEVALLWPVFTVQSGTWTKTASAQDGYYYHLASSGTQNDLISWVTETGIMLRPGTYRLDALVEFRSGCGKIHCLIDNVDGGNVDTYNASTTYNNVVTISNLAITGFSAHGIQLKMASKNASASSYTGRITLARLIRTGA